MKCVISLPENHIFYASQQAMQSLFSDELNKLGIGYFSTLRVYQNNEGCIFGTNFQVIQYLLENAVPLAAPTLPNIVKKKFHYFVVPTGPYVRALHDLKNDFNLAYFFNFVEHHKDFFDIFCFGASPDNQQMINFYLSNIELLQKFISLFKDERQTTFNICYSNRILIPHEMLPDFKNCYGAQKADERILSPRLSECLQILTEEYTAKKIALRMGISIRTVENYLEELKVRFRCNNKSDLLFLARAYRNNHDL